MNSTDFKYVVLNLFKTSSGASNLRNASINFANLERKMKNKEKLKILRKIFTVLIMAKLK